MIRAPRHFMRVGTLPAILVLAASVGQTPDVALAQVSASLAGRLSECVGRPGQEPVLCKGVPHAGIYLTDSLRSDDKTRTWRTLTNQEGEFTFEFDTLLARHCYHLGLTKFGGRLLYDSVRVNGRQLPHASQSLEAARDSSAGCIRVGGRAVDSLEIVVFSNRAAAVAVVAMQILPPPDPRVEGWRLGLGGGATSLFAGGMSFVTPAVTVFGAKDGRWYVTVLGGWRPLPSAGQDPLYPSQLSAPRPQFGARAQGMAAINASLFPSRIRRSPISDDTLLVSVPGWWGIAAGVQGAWETVRGSDEYLKRAYGFTIGPRFRVNPLGRFDIALGVDLMIANLSEFGQPDSRWRFGVGPTVTVGYFLR